MLCRSNALSTGIKAHPNRQQYSCLANGHSSSLHLASCDCTVKTMQCWCTPHSFPQVVFEPAAPVGSKATFSQDSSAEAGAATEAKDEGPLFPHLYGTIDYAAVIQVSWGGVCHRTSGGALCTAHANAPLHAVCSELHCG